MTGVSLLLGNCMVPFFTHTGTLQSVAGFKLESHVEQVPRLGAFILVLYFTTAMRSCILLGHACKDEVSVNANWTVTRNFVYRVSDWAQAIRAASNIKSGCTSTEDG